MSSSLRRTAVSRPSKTGFALAAVAGVFTATALTTSPSSVAADEGAIPDRIVLNPTPTPATSQEVTWRTDSAVEEGWVEFQPAAGGAIRTAQAGATQEAAFFIETDAHHHSAVLDGLTPDTEYSYRVGTDAGWSEWHSFTSADDSLDAGDEPWTFLYFGDAQNGLEDKWPPVVDAAFEAYPDAELTVHAGDQINDAQDDAQWGQWFAGLGDHLAETQTVTTLGNHELTIDPGASQYRAHYEYPHNGPATQDELVWYTDYQGVRFISLNGNAPLGGALDQAPWLREVLGDNPSRWTVVTFHQPMFSNTDDRDNIATRSQWLPIFEEYGVDLVLQGHDHTYARGHLTENENPDGSVSGPVYTVAVGGSKYYEPSAEGDNNWTDNGATRVVSHGETSTFQAITVTDDRLTYRAVVGAVGEGSTAPDGVGSTIDAFTIERADDGSKKVVPGETVSEPTRTRVALMVEARRFKGTRGRAVVRFALPQDVAVHPPTGRMVAERRAGEQWVRVGASTVRAARTTVALTRLPDRAIRLRLRYLGDDNTRPAREVVRLPRR